MDTNDLEGRKKKRITIGANLIIGEDDDLIAWAESYQNGERNAAVKATLRLGLGIERVKVRAGQPGRPRTKNQMLPAEIMQRLEQLEHENELLRQYRDYNEQRWLSWEQGSPERPPEVIESVPDLDANVKAERTSKLKQAKW